MSDLRMNDSVNSHCSLVSGHVQHMHVLDTPCTSAVLHHVYVYLMAATLFPSLSPYILAKGVHLMA